MTNGERFPSIPASAQNKLILFELKVRLGQRTTLRTYPSIQDDNVALCHEETSVVSININAGIIPSFMI